MADTPAPYRITKVGRAIRTHIPYTWHCDVPVPATAITTNTSTIRCGASRAARTDREAHADARAHIATAHPDVELPEEA